MSKRYTHVIQIFPEKEERVMVAPQKAEVQVTPARYALSRWDTGLVVGMAQGLHLNVIDVKNEKNTTTSYRDAKYAVAALKEYADRDARDTYGEPHAYIEEIDMSKSVIEQPSLSAISSINRVK